MENESFVISRNDPSHLDLRRLLVAKACAYFFSAGAKIANEFMATLLVEGSWANGRLWFGARSLKRSESDIMPLAALTDFGMASLLRRSRSNSGSPDPVQFVFFKGIKNAGNGNGLLSATITDGLPAGNYRV